ncbi:hypothetical protein B0A75_06405 [Flavobacterium oncorhynchi]|uniref:Uncharacterized protein n=1 Tax=Flavobacterium oncorhynchi TaxID=728056 RepID=A0A226I4K0_9FLAO|nr:hypothetical protein [Flavobacterium oncorhynchi]OXB01196.1 hypothetical protein B0A75_06405 [Flavobacterium oncorhynchi]
MKQFCTLFLVFATYLTFGQNNQNKYDYFVQFNGNQLSKKVNIDEVLNHPVLNKYKDRNSDFDISKYTSLVYLDKQLTVHGNFTDSIPYCQITIPIKDKDAARQFLLHEYSLNKNTDSVITPNVQDFGNFSILTTKNEKESFAWNDNYLVILKLTKKFHSNRYDIPAAVTLQDSIAIDEPYKELSIEEPAVTDNSTVVEESPYSNESYAEYTKEEDDFNQKLAEQQNLMIKALFEKGFTVPVSDKINALADISSWVNYGAVMTGLYSSYSYPMAIFGGYDKFLPNQKNLGNFVKGINLDFYFDSNNARIEEVIEYSEQIAEVVGKISNRKINKNIFNYFPVNKPLGYMSYHINTQAALENIPSLMTDLFNSPALKKDDVAVVTDLISTIVDEEATAKLFDGDLSLFLYDSKKVEVVSKSYDYDENFEPIEKEEKIKKTVPLFAVIFTSTHPTFGDKLLQLGVRKQFLTQNGNAFLIEGTKEYGDLFIIKDKDVVVVANTLDYFSKEKGSFVAEAKKDLKKNYMFGKLNIGETINVFAKLENTNTSDFEKFNKISKQFSDITFESPKKLINNKLIFAVKLNTLKSDKNIILQTLDLADEMTSK